MENQKYIETVLEAAKQALSLGHTNRVRNAFVVQYQKDDSLSFESEHHEAWVAEDNKTWYVHIDGQSYKVGEFPDFWKPADTVSLLAETVINKRDFNDETLNNAKQECVEYLITQSIHHCKKMDEEDIRRQIESGVEFTVFDTTNPNSFKDEKQSFSYNRYNREGNCGVIAECEILVEV